MPDAALSRGAVRVAAVFAADWRAPHRHLDGVAGGFRGSQRQPGGRGNPAAGVDGRDPSSAMAAAAAASPVPRCCPQGDHAQLDCGGGF